MVLKIGVLKSNFSVEKLIPNMQQKSMLGFVFTKLKGVFT